MNLCCKQKEVMSLQLTELKLREYNAAQTDPEQYRVTLAYFTAFSVRNSEGIKDICDSENMAINVIL